MRTRFWTGLIFLLFGTGFLLHQLNIWDFPEILGNWWPLILIVIGIVQLTNRTNASWIPGFLFIVVGGLFLINQWINLNIGAIIWPLIFIFIGLVIIFTRGKQNKPISSDNAIDTFALFSGTEIISQANQFEGGSATAIFGGSEIDLRDAVVPESGATLELTTIFGGISIRPPENARVEITGLPIFGGWENKARRHVNEEDLPVLHLKCLTICGGVEVKD